MTFKPGTEKTPNIPFCAYEGLNYSSVLDSTNNKISDIKYAETGFTNEPIAYNIDYENLINEEIAKGFGFDFGEVKPLLDWFIILKGQIIDIITNNQK